MRFFRFQGLDRSQWLSVAALSAALFSVGLSVSMAACQGARAEPPGAELQAKPASTGSAAQLDPARSATTASPAVAGSGPAASTPHQTAVAKAGTDRPGVTSAKPTATETASGRLGVTRFLIASAIEQREPVEVSVVPLDAERVYAFAELDNREGGARVVEVTFEREGRSEGVGHVKLAIPASTKRWRTWASTRLLDAAGPWTAVLRDERGNELARTPFEVAASSR